MNQLDPALTSLGMAIQADPGYAEAYRARGRVFMRREMFRQAADDFTRAIELEPDAPGIHALRGNALHALGQLQAAAADYSEALRRQPQSEYYRKLLEQVSSET